MPQVDPYASGVLQKKHHERIVADLSGFAKDAGIQEHWIYTSLIGEAPASAIEYIKSFRQIVSDGKLSGVLLMGKTPTADQIMAAMAGALVRNFIRARVVTASDLFTEGNDLDHLSCILVPNFFLSKDGAGHIASWQIQTMFDVIMSRKLRGLQTVLYATDMQLLGKEYGLAFSSFLKANYVLVDV